MRFAIASETRKEASPALSATCPHCCAPVVAKCGSKRVWHWAHTRDADCDTWSEPESEWHRQWKEVFPESWQEITCVDPISGERHIADVRTPRGLVLEFQHSQIARDEISARSTFYGNIVWVIDAARTETHCRRVRRAIQTSRRLPGSMHVVSATGLSALLDAWRDQAERMYLDTRGYLLWELVRFNPYDRTYVLRAHEKRQLVTMWNSN